MRTEQTPDTKRGPYYVTALEAGKVFPMAGPYTLHAEALAAVDQARAIASQHDGRAWFASWGTCRLPDYAKPGRLNQLGLIA